MDKEEFHIHGDNIVECERMVSYIVAGLPQTTRQSYGFRTPACPEVTIEYSSGGERHEWTLILYPGFNKSTGSRWSSDIFQPIKRSGGFLEETPDVVVSRIEGNQEHILFAVEFCNALQAGNQAWQRSGRALSTSRSGCPYLYIIGFVNYEIDSKTRERKALRFPNAAIPYSYLSYSKASGVFVSQAYVRAEEFQPSFDSKLSLFDEEAFSEKDISQYIVAKMSGCNTRSYEESFAHKTMSVVKFLASQGNRSKNRFSVSDWESLFQSGLGVIEYSSTNASFPMRKKIAEKSTSSPSLIQFRNLVMALSKGVSSDDLPVGVIPPSNIRRFKDALKRIYRSEAEAIEAINETDELVICMLKGFKPKGEDARPERGTLPLATMLSFTPHQILTIVYGPILFNNYRLFVDDKDQLAQQNGLWNSILSLSDFVVLDAPILRGNLTGVSKFFDNSAFKRMRLSSGGRTSLTADVVDQYPSSYKEDDVNTALHILFSNSAGINGFECMCNPPGGDWSGVSIISGDREFRWTSLPRVTPSGEKRPDHMTEIVGLFDKPLLVITESKGDPSSLEPNVGQGLIDYIVNLMNHKPSVVRVASKRWEICQDKITANDYRFISAAAYLKGGSSSDRSIHDNSGCNLLFEMEPKPINNMWRITLVPFTEEAIAVAQYIKRRTAQSHLFSICIRNLD